MFAIEKLPVHAYYGVSQAIACSKLPESNRRMKKISPVESELA